MSQDIEIYTFEDKDGDAEGHETSDYSEAIDYAQRHKLKVISNTYAWQDSECTDDYTEEDEDEDEDDDEEEDDDDLYDGVEPSLTVEASDGQGNA